MRWSVEQVSELLTRWKNDSIPVGILIIGTSGLRASMDGVIGEVTASGFRCEFVKGWLIFPFINSTLDYIDNTEPTPRDFPEMANYLCGLIIRHDFGELCALFEMWPEEVST